MKPNVMVQLCKQALMAWLNDSAPGMGAAFAYYAVFSLAPPMAIVMLPHLKRRVLARSKGLQKRYFFSSC